MAYRGFVFVVVIIIFLANHSLMPSEAAALSFHYNFSAPGVLDSANLSLLYRNDSFANGDRISLTQMVNGSAGRVAYAQPLQLWNCRTGSVASFSTNFTFAIHGNHNNTRGDGMKFFVGSFPPIAPSDSLAGFLGLYNNPDHSGSPPIVAVEFDTFWNPELDPLGVTDHVGIDINSIHSTNYTTDVKNLSLCGTMSANITYDAGSKMMVASLQLADGSIHSVETPIDFRAAGLPQDVAVGFSAATGLYWESHEVLSWSFNSTVATELPSQGLPDTTINGTAVISLPAPREFFLYQELSAATDNFSSDRKLGEGAFGEVYLGHLPGQLAVAVKRLTLQSDTERTRRGYAEIMTLGQLHHRNLEKLVGWCDGGEHLLLVYELMANRSVDRHLHNPKWLLTWPERYKIVLGIGYAIEYLHTGYPSAILHRDIKPSNVMLNDDMEAKLGDFGLVRQVPRQGYLRGTAMMGSTDYIDPVCISNSTATVASDMYSFGVLLLEIATGRDPATMREELGRPSALVDVVRDSYARGTVLQEADRRLNGDFDQWQMERVLVAGLLCVRPDRHDRPSIREAVYLLSNRGHPLPDVRV